VRSARNWGIGDFGDLRALLEMTASLGGALVGVNPLHAGGASPYSPSSRHALNVLYLDIEALPEFQRSAAARRRVSSSAFKRRLEQLREAELVDYEGVARLKMDVLELLFERLASPKEFHSYLRKASREVHQYALFEALREKLGGGWPDWPAKYRDP